MEEALHESGPLQGEGRNEEVEAHTAEAITLQEGHEKTEANEDHHMHILETWAQTETMKSFLFLVKKKNIKKNNKRVQTWFQTKNMLQ